MHASRFQEFFPYCLSPSDYRQRGGLRMHTIFESLHHHICLGTLVH